MNRTFLLHLPLILVSLASAMGQSPTPQPHPIKRTLEVIGEAEVKAAPDQVMITLGVETIGKTAAEAMASNNEQMNALIKAIRDAGIEQKNIRTSRIDLSPQYRQGRNPESRPELYGFRATNQVRVVVSKVENLGKLLDAVVQAGANRIDSIQFDVVDKKPLLDQAKKEAVADAQRKAKLLAEAAGMELGQPILISEFQPGMPRPMMKGGAERMAFAAMMDTPVEPGELTFTETINITFELISKSDK